ncbi:hypothetical protein BGW38_006159 [Lunasporangiospora selenospora]|uniref:Secreted protein n=1 Tax=Lunasporangiospora selenospora TaxID=979761 RepID=A0A9P6FP15_9FUNG|nr:hypothetical protein BGW38_006159 [Lunasporangiospora selenospora]
MMRSQVKFVLMAMLVAVLATMAMAAPSSSKKSSHPATTSHAKPHSKKTPAPKPTGHKKPPTPKKPKKKAPKGAVDAAKKPKTKATKATTKPSKAKSTSPAAAKPTPAKMGQTGVIVSATDFCVFLPPKFGGDIAANEDRAVAFCTKPNMPGAPNAQVLPKGFIQSAHLVSNSTGGWIQVTGRIDRSKYGLSPKDGGGQYDVKAPVGAICAGYKSFVQLTEPDAQIYCIRCCMNKIDCPVNKSTYGCKRVLGGDYS